MDILDIHTHHAAPQPKAVISVTPASFSPEKGQRYSVGIHPWDTSGAPSEDDFRILAEAAASDAVVCIGECGVDTLRGGPMFRQLQIFGRHVSLSEEVKKPLVIHSVKAHDIILGLKKDLNPKQPWAIHGFRGKPSVAGMLMDKGIYISLGEKFNPDTLRLILCDARYRELLLAETDESSESIESIISAMSKTAGEDLIPLIAANISRYLGHTESI